MNILTKKRIAAILMVSLAILYLSASSGFAKTPDQRISGSVKVIREMAEQQDASSMASVIRRGKGIAIFPSVVKAGFVLGGKYGEGLVLRRDPSSGKWYGPSFVNVAGASWGLQIGAQSIALVLVVNNERGLEAFTSGSDVKLGGDVAVAAGPVGRRGEAATDIHLKASMYSYSMSKGLFAGMSIEGAGLNEDENANHVYWGSSVSARSALNKRATDKRIRPLIQEIEKLMKKAD